MRRRDFGSWGSELSSDDFARALAALGVVQARLGRWPDDDGVDGLASVLVPPPGETGLDPVSWTLNQGPEALPALLHPTSAATLAAAWRRSVAGSWPGPRIEIDRMAPAFADRDPAAALPWIAEQLSRVGVEARSVYIRSDQPVVKVGWQWPLRVGLLRDPRSADFSARLAAALPGHQWLPKLVSIVAADADDGECDILVLPMDLRPALAAIAALPTPPRADCVLVIGRTQGPVDQWFRLVDGLRAAAATSGVVLVHLPAESHADWFEALVRELSHNQPLDVALFSVRPSVESAPLISAARRLVDFSSLAKQLKRMATRFEAPRMAPHLVEPPAAPAAAGIVLHGGSRALGEIARELEQIAENAERDPGYEWFMRESGMASAAAELAMAADDAGAEMPPDDPEPRYIQAQVYESAGAATGMRPMRRTRSWRAGAAHEIHVRIGSPGQEWITAPADAPFPVERLPPDQDEHELTVVITEPHLLDEPQVATITLPRHGDSTECRFHLFVRPDIVEVRARLIVIHRNRVLQTAILRGPVSATAEDVHADRIVVEPEATVRVEFGDLARRQPFDAALVLNHSGTGIPGVTTIADGGARSFNVSPDLAREIAWFDARLTEVATDRTLFEGGLESEAIVEMLRSFARHGELLYKHIVRSGIGEGGLARGERIQIVSAVAGARLPAEFIYDRRAPKDDATLCPNAAASLRAGACRDGCPGLQSPRDHICPLGFWGLSRILERHSEERRITRPELAGLVDLKAHAFRVEPVEGRDTLPVLRSGLVAGSQRVERSVPGGLESICERITGGHPGLEPVPNWDEWTSKIDCENPSLLVLIVHTDLSHDHLERMEIGTDSWLSVVDLENEHIARDSMSPPIVLLLGCETGAPTVSFGGFVTRCLEYGAAVVVSTGAKIHSVHAVPVAQAYVDALRSAVAEGAVTFGEVMRSVRRTLLADGLPMVLTLTAHGDADWRLVPHDS
jgi:hypothetical protein